MDGALAEVVPDRRTRLDIFIRRMKCWLAVFSMLMVGLLPPGRPRKSRNPPAKCRAAQPPQALTPPGEQPILRGQTVIDRVRPNLIWSASLR